MRNLGAVDRVGAGRPRLREANIRRDLVCCACVWASLAVAPSTAQANIVRNGARHHGRATGRAGRAIRRRSLTPISTPLKALYDSVSDEQKARLNALADSTSARLHANFPLGCLNTKRHS